MTIMVLFGLARLGLLRHPGHAEHLVLHLEHVLGRLAGGLHVDRGEPLGQPPHGVVHRPAPAPVLRVRRLIRPRRAGSRPRLLDAAPSDAARVLLPRPDK